VGLSSRPGSRPWCGGMLISNEWVLSAAHCLSGQSRVNVIAGEYDTSRRSGTEQERYSSRIITHPRYNSRTYSYDFGLIKLESPVTFGSCVGAVNLPTGDVPASSSCWITGWGTLSSGGSQPNILQEAEVTVLSNTECTTDFGYSSSEIDTSMLCAQGRKNGQIQDACQGDSGGPLVCKSGGSWFIHGATSWGYGCAGAQYPGVWARVYKELSWIQDTVSGSAPSPTPPSGGCPSATSTGPDSDGDCRCNTGLICRENGSRGCTYSYTALYGSKSTRWFLPSCSGCVCS